MTTREKSGFMRGLYDILSGYALSCVLLLFLFLLTYLGTLAQVEVGLHQAQKLYFESWFLVHKLGPVPLPLPGGQLCMWLLGLNLLFGGFIRIRKTRATAGIIVVHVGIVMLLLAAVVKLRGSEDGYLRLYETETDSVFVDYVKNEVAVWDAGSREGLTEYVIGTEDLRACTGEDGRTFKEATLPFELTLSHFLINSDALPKGPNWIADSPVLDGYALRARDPELEAAANAAGVVATIRTRGSGEVRQAILHTYAIAPWTVEVDGRTWAVDLRRVRYPMPFSIRLDKFYKVDHPGMSMAREFKSDVVKIEGDVEQPVLIEMNEPLRAGGLVLYQADFGPKPGDPPGPTYSVFAVKRDPSDQWPLIATIVITLGMGWAFSLKLLKHVKSSRKRGSSQPA